MYYFSPSTLGFYETSTNGDNIPADAVPLTEEERVAIRAGQEAGKAISAGSDGFPVLVDSVPEVTVPREISKASAKIVLARNGLLAPLLAYINSLPDTDEDKIIFLDMATWTRDSPTLIRLARGVLGLNDQQLDEFFIAADQLTI